MTLKELTEGWVDTPEWHEKVNNELIERVNSCQYLKEHRDFVEQNAFGFGERSFHWFWHELIKEMPEYFTFLEIGIFRGASLSLIELISNEQNKTCSRSGVSPLDSTDGHWESDYEKDIRTIHSRFNINQCYCIFKGLSTDNRFMRCAYDGSPYDIVYIDGGHTYEVITSDLRHYPNMVNVGGYLVVDDACNDLHMPWGFFQGIDAVTQAVKEWENPNFEFQFNVVHLRVYKRVA